MKLYVARHGLTNYNEAHLCNNDPSVNVYLTEEGIHQAKNLAEFMKSATLDIIFTSELRRTIQTAGYVNKFHNVQLDLDSRLGDTITGFEGRPTSEYFEQLQNSKNRWDASFNGGESLNDLISSEYENVLIVTSQYIVFAFIYWLEGLSDEEAWSSDVAQGSYRIFNLI